MKLNWSELIVFFKGHTRGAKAKREVLYSIFMDGLTILIGVIYVPLLLNYLTQEKYGIWLTLTSILGWFSFFDIGLGNGLRNKLTEAFAQDDYELGKKLVSTTYTLLIAIFSIVLLIFHLCNFFLDWNSILNTNTIEKRELYILTSIVFTFFIIRFIFQIILVVYLADQRPSVTKILKAVGNFLSLSVVLILVKSTIKGNLVLLGTIITVIPVLVLIIATFISFNKKYLHIKPSFHEVDLKMSNGLINLGFKFFFMQISYIIGYTTSNLFITQFYGPGEVAVYNIAYKYFYIPVMLYSIVLSPIWSAVTDAYIKSDFVWLKRTIKQLDIISIVFSIGILIMILISKWVYKFWIGDSISIPFSLSIALGIYSISIILVAPYSNFINGIGKLNLTLWLYFTGTVSYILLVFVFKEIFANSIGIVLAFICTQLISLIAAPMQTRKLLNRTAKGIWNR